jgi:hypothetical protein
MKTVLTQEEKEHMDDEKNSQGNPQSTVESGT